MSIGSWLATLAIAVALVVFAATTGNADLHLGVAALVAVVLTAFAIRENWALTAGGASDTAIAGSTARNNGLVWAWGALVIIITSLAVIDGKWPEWWQFFLGFGVAAVGSVLFALAMARDEANGRKDDAMLKVGRGLVIAQAVGVVAALISMFVDGKFPRDVRYADWVGCAIFFCGGVAILLISLNALRNAR